jgi:4-hydroxy-tetrahydrodipicolinate synthase
MTAIVTPFLEGQVDYEKLEQLIEWQIKEGIQGIVPCGTTGESATLSHQEHKDIVKFVVSVVKKRVPVVAGTGSNNTIEAIELTEAAEDAGADASLLITPYYNKPTQEGLYRHFKLVAESTDLPIVLYNVPSRTGVNMLPATVARLAADLKNVVAVKEASGSVDQTTEIIQATAGKIDVLSGDDSLTLALMSVGAKGVISVASNVVPAGMRKLCDAVLAGRLEEARGIHMKLYPLMKNLFVETNPIPVKYALHLMGRIGEEIRLPMTALADAYKDKLRQTLKDSGVL